MSSFVPTGHADLDQLRRDGVAAYSPWYLLVGAGALAGLTLVVAVPFVYLVYILFAAAIDAWQGGFGAAAAGLHDGFALAAQYGRYAWLGALAIGGVGAAYALLRRHTVLRGRYLRLGPWELGLHTLSSAVAGYVAFYFAGAAWPPLQQLHVWLFWAWGPMFAWSLSQLHTAYTLWLVRPDWALSVTSTARVVFPRRFGCPDARVRLELDENARALTVYAPIDAAVAERARELIQAVPETRTVTIHIVDAAADPAQTAPESVAASRSSSAPSPRTQPLA